MKHFAYAKEPDAESISSWRSTLERCAGVNAEQRGRHHLRDGRRRLPSEGFARATASQHGLEPHFVGLGRPLA